MKKMTIKEAKYNISSALRGAKRTFEDGFMYQGYKDDTKRYLETSIQRLKDSKAKASKIFLSKMYDKLTEWEDKAWEQQQERMEIIKKAEEDARTAITVLRSSINWLVYKLENHNKKAEADKTIYKHLKTYLQFMPEDATFEGKTVYDGVVALEYLRNDLVKINQEMGA